MPKSLISTLVSLRTLLALSFALLTTVLTLSLAYLISERHAQMLEQEIGNALANVAWHMRDDLDSGMFERYRDIQIAASLPVFHETHYAPESRRVLLDTLQRTYPAYAWIGYADVNGKVLQATAGMLEGADVSSRPWFQQGRMRAVTLDVHDAKLLAKLLPRTGKELPRFVDIATPVTDEYGKTIGVLGAHLNWEWAKDVQKTVLEQVKGKRRVELFILRQDGEILLGPPGESGRLQLDALSPIKPDKAHYAIRTWSDGRRYLTGYARTDGHKGYDGLGWTVVVRQDLSEAFVPINEARRHILLAGLGVGLISVGIGLWLARRLAKPLTVLARHADAVRQGLTHTPMPIVASYAEAETLSRSLHELMQHRQQAEKELQELNQTLEQRIDLRTEEISIVNRALSKAMEHQFQIHQSLQQSEAKIRSILHNAHEAYIGIDHQGVITEWNEQAEMTFGWTYTEAIGRPLDELIIPERYRAAHRRGMAHFLASGEGPVLNRRIELTALRRDDREIPVELTIATIQTEDGYSFHAFLHDVSERKQAEEALRHSRERLQTITDNVPVLIAYIDKDLHYRFSNRTYLDWFGHAPRADGEMDMTEFISPDDMQALRPHVERVLQGHKISFEKSWQLKGRALHSLMTYLPHQNEAGETLGFYVLGQDITERKQLELSLEELALNDTLTGLPNRRALIKTLAAALPLTQRTGKVLGLLFLDLDGFKAVNDRLGHEAGDELLRQVGQRIQAQLRQTDTVARLGGDEFTVVLDLLNNGRQDAEAIAAKIIEAMHPPFVLTGDASAHISTSIGIALHRPGADTTPENLLAQADAAMYAAKRRGKNRFA